jgi:hypothetical protein
MLSKALTQVEIHDIVPDAEIAPASVQQKQIAAIEKMGCKRQRR